MNCPSCGKKLSAPESAVGKKAKCPACGTLMVVPKAVLEAEVISAAPQEPASNVFSLMDEIPAAAPSQPLASSAGVGQEPARRPCPECGEMIVAGAAKCRFCNAIFDPQLKKMGSVRLGGKGEELKQIAYYQRRVMSCILVQIVAYVPCAAFSRTNPALAGIFGLVVLCALIAGVCFAVLLAMRVYSTGVGIIMGLLGIIPCFGLLMLLIINQAATKRLTNSGIKVGFLGADMSQF